MSDDQSVREKGGRRGLLRYVRAAFRFVTDRSFRSIMNLRWFGSRNLFQPSNHTLANRYPVLFQRARKGLGDRPDLRLLSFGCATGEEVFTLRQYFPDATIKGIDINPYNISVCRKRLASHPDPKIEFELADSVEREPPAAYDAIFCMAVFRHSELADPRHTRCDRFIRFELFCRMVEDIARRLKPGGLLMIMHSNFRFRDTPTAEQFEVACRMNLTHSAHTPTPVFDRENRRTGEVNYGEVIFRKKTSTIANSCSP